MCSYIFLILLVTVQDSGTIDGAQLHLSVIVVVVICLGFGMPHDEQLYLSVVLLVIVQDSGAIDNEQLYFSDVAVVSLQDLGELHDEQLHYVVFVSLLSLDSVLLFEKHGMTQRITLTWEFSNLSLMCINFADVSHMHKMDILKTCNE